MAASGIRCTFVMEVGRKSPSETFVYNAETIASAIEPAIKLAKLRRATMGAGAAFFGVRLSKEGVRRDSRVLNLTQIAAINSIPLALTGSNAGISDNASDQAPACLNVRFEASDLSRSDLFMAGVPDAVLRQNPESPPVNIPAPWQAAFDLWAAELVNFPWGFIGRSLTGAEGIVPRQVVAVGAQIATGFVQLVITTPAPQFTQSQLVQLRNFRMVKRVYTPAQGQFRIDSVEPDTPIPGQTRLTLRNSAAINVETIKDFGTVEIVDFLFRKYTNVVLQRQTTHKRGNSSLSGPGRLTIRERV